MSHVDDIITTIITNVNERDLQLKEIITMIKSYYSERDPSLNLSVSNLITDILKNQVLNEKNLLTLVEILKKYDYNIIMGAIKQKSGIATSDPDKDITDEELMKIKEKNEETIINKDDIQNVLKQYMVDSIPKTN